jgi:hypothetical protein
MEKSDCFGWKNRIVLVGKIGLNGNNEQTNKK